VSARYEELSGRLGEIADLRRAAELLAWDERTHMPRGGAEPRAEHMSTLARITHEMMISDELGNLLTELEPWGVEQDYASDEASTIRSALRTWRKARRVPSDLAAEIAAAESTAEHAWVEARAASDFGALLPHLQKLYGLKRRLIDCFDDFDHPYDVLLDDFEPEMTVAQVRPVLESLRDGLTGLLGRITDTGIELDDSCLHGDFDLGRQRELGTALCELMPLRDGGWRLDETAHPFASGMAPSDIRLTTRYEQGFLGTTIWSIVHEAGHGIYESGMPDALRRLPIGEPPSLGLHESQSRLWENWVGRSRPYQHVMLAALRNYFPDAFADVDVEELYRAANTVRRSLIRTEADEVTYNLHVVIRFELEVELFEERLAVEDLPEAWDERYKKYLDLDVPDVADGVLQDVHWPSGAFGYFPTYSLGNVIAAQLWNAASAEIGDLESQLQAGELEPLRAWLDTHLYALAGRFTPAETIERAVGGTLDTSPLLAHLERKYGELYGLDGSPAE
jgi:carboxypeptidase Taq